MLARRRFAGRHRALRPGLAPLRPVPPGCWKAAPGLRWRFPFPRQVAARRPRGGLRPARRPPGSPPAPTGRADVARGAAPAAVFALSPRSEEHTSELQSRFDLVCRLLLEKKKS